MEETKPTSRLNRTKRDVETRATQERPKQWKAPEILPEINKEEGYSYRFVRTSTMGVPDAFAMTDQNSQFEDSIEIGGLLLCKTDEELTKQRDAYYAKKTGEVMESVDNNFMRDQDPRMPLFNDRKTKTTFGKG
jgi:hypothetical protein